MPRDNSQLTAALDEVLVMLESFSEAHGEEWVIPETVNAKVRNWELGSDVWKSESEPSDAALDYVCERLITDYRRGRSGRDDDDVARLHRLFDQEPSLAALAQLAAAIRASP